MPSGPGASSLNFPQIGSQALAENGQKAFAIAAKEGGGIEPQTGENLGPIDAIGPRSQFLELPSDRKPGPGGERSKGVCYRGEGGRRDRATDRGKPRTDRCHRAPEPVP